MAYSQDFNDSDGIRNNKLYNRILKEQIEGHLKSLELNPSDDHIGFVRAQASISALRLLDEMLIAPSEILDNNERE